MKKARILLMLILLGFCFINTVNAADTDDKHKSMMSLQQVIDLALKANHHIYISNIDVAASKEAKKGAFTEFLPKIKTEYGASFRSEKNWQRFQDDPKRYYLSNKHNYVWTTSAIQTIFKGLAVITGYQIADLELQTADIRKASTKLSIILEAKKKYFGVQNTKLLVEVARQAIKSLEEHLSVAKEYYDVGLSPRIDVLNAEVDISNAYQDFEKAKSNVIIAKAALNNVMDIPVDSEIEVESTLKHDPFTITYKKCVSNALELRPGLKEARKNIEIAKKQVTLAGSDYFPHITASVNYNRAGDNPNVNGSHYYDRANWDTMVIAEWTLFEWGKTHYARQKANEGVKKSARVMSIVEDRIHFEVKQAFQYLKTANHNIKVAEKGVESAVENLEISKDRYKEQVATITEILDAQTRLTSARTSLTNVLNDYNISLAELYRAMGME